MRYSLALFAVPVLAFSQVTLREDVRQVLVPVVVTDKSGHHVSGLTSKDFQILEDGIEQKITSVLTSNAPGQNQSSTAPIAPTPAASLGRSAADAPRYTYLICIDVLHSSVPNLNRVRQALQKFFSGETAGDAQYALFVVGREIQPVVDSTRDPHLVNQAIENKDFLKHFTDSESRQTVAEIQEFTYFMRDYYCRSCACSSVGSRDSVGCPAQQSRLQSYLLRSRERTRALDLNYYAALTRLVAATAAMPTSRTILLVSDGFNRYPGRELYGILQGFAPQDHRFEFNPADTSSSLETIIRKAQANNIRFYTIDSRGLYSLASIGGSSFDASTGSLATPNAVDSNAATVARENTDALAELARDTGGLFFENNNNLFEGIRRAFADGREYYVLAYVPSNAGNEHRFHRIQVEVARKGVHVNAKSGYWN